MFHEKLDVLTGKVDNQGTRITTLEAHRQRDAEDKLAGVGPNGTGRFNIVPERGGGADGGSDPPMRKPNPPPPQSWWAREPFRTAIGYAAAALVAGGIAGWSGHAAVTVPVPTAIDELPHASTLPAPPPAMTVVAEPATAAAVPDAGVDARRLHP